MFQFISKKAHKKKKNKQTDEKTEAQTDGARGRKGDESSPSKKKKKKKKKNKSNDEKGQESGKKNDLDSTKTKKAPNFDIEKLKAALGKEGLESGKKNDLGGGFSHEKTLKHDEAKNRLKSSQFRFLNEKLYSQNGVQSLKMFNTDKVS